MQARSIFWWALLVMIVVLGLLFAFIQLMFTAVSIAIRLVIFCAVAIVFVVLTTYFLHRSGSRPG